MTNPFAGGALASGVGTGATAARLLARAGVRPGVGRAALATGATAAPLGAVNEVGKIEGDKSIGDYGETALSSVASFLQQMDSANGDGNAVIAVMRYAEGHRGRDWSDLIFRYRPQARQASP